jgi:xanthine dehydrogenase YagS FAD-binding subunit
VRPFDYARAGDAASAVALLEEHPHGRFLAGGTNLVDLMRLGVETPRLLVDVRQLSGSRAVEETREGGLLLGAALSNAELAADPLVRERYPVLSAALLQGASGQLRNLATVGGNLLQRTRCHYFQDVGKACNKRAPGSGCPAREGEHRNLAILGASEACVATHPSDMAVALAALGADIHLVSPRGARTVPIVEFHRLPGDQPARDSIIEPGELIVAVELPPLAAARHSRYVKVRERASFSFAVVSLAAALAVEDGTVRDVRLARGGVAHKPWRADTAEGALRGGPAHEAAFARAADAELAAARPLRDNSYKIALARSLIVSVLRDLADAA